MIVLADMRWPEGTGIGRMASLYSSFRPSGTELRDVRSGSRIGSPLSPLALSIAVRRDARGASVFWNPGFIPTAFTGVRSVITVHDLTHLHFYSRVHRWYYASVLRPLYRHADAIVCVSHYTRNEFLEWSGVEPANVSVVYNALPPGFASLAARSEADRPYVFYAGNHRHYKNLGNLIRGFARSGLAAQGIKLRMTGKPSVDLVGLAKALQIESSVDFVGHLNDRELVTCYKTAGCVAFLSRYEGFGLPLLEAMACSTPLVIADTSCLPEIAGDAAIAVPPDDVDAIGVSLWKVMTEPALANELRSRGHRRLAAFEAGASATQLWKTIAETAAGR